MTYNELRDAVTNIVDQTSMLEEASDIPRTVAPIKEINKRTASNVLACVTDLILQAKQLEEKLTRVVIAS